MQKHANRILSALLALIMVISMVPATVFADGETDVFAGWSLTLGDHIGVNFYLAEEAANYTVTTTVAGTNAAHTAAVKDGKYVITVHVAAAQMTDTIGLTVMNGETQVHTGEYSVRQYAESILTGSYDVEVQEMVKVMLNYGAAAQNYFAHNTNNLANAGYQIENGAEISQEVPEITVTDNLSDLNLYGMTLMFRSKTAVRFYFTGSVEGHSFAANGAALTPVEKDGMWYVEVDGINPQDLNTDITVSVDDGALSVTYSPMTYVVRMYHKEGGSQELKALTQAMYGYYLEALDYQQYQKIAQLGTLNAHADPYPWVLNENHVKLRAMLGTAVPVPGDYRPLSEDAVKLVRDGVTYNVGKLDTNILVLQSDNQCFITASTETLGDLFPLQANDYLIIEGRFKYWAGDTVQIGKTYVYFDGSKVEISTTVPTLPTAVEAGVMKNHEGGLNENGLYFRLDANDAFYTTDWSTEYAQTSADNIKLIRNGETISIGAAGRPMFVKFSEIDYFLKLEGWIIGANNYPITTEDVLIIEGSFTHAASKTTLNITKSYVYHNGTAWVCSDTEPVQTQIHKVGVLSQGKNYGTNGVDIADNGWNIYALADANTLPFDGWNYEYTPVSAENLKLIRDGVTYDVGIPGQGTIVKFNENAYCVKMYPWTVAGSKLPLVAGDILIIEGQYTLRSDSNVVANFAKTYILVNSDNTCTFSATEPVLPIQGGMLMEVQGYGWTGAEGDLIFKMNNDAPTGQYAPTSASNVKLIRDGQTYDVGYVGQGVIEKHNDGWYTLKFWTIVNYKPLLANDILVVEGNFKNTTTGDIMEITKTYVLLNEDKSATFSATEPELKFVVDCGNMSAHEDGTADEIYFSMAENVAPVDEDAAYPYAGTVTLKDGSTVDVNIYKLTETQYYLENATLSDGQYLIVEGEFVNSDNGYTLNIAKTYVQAKGGELVYSTTEPVTTIQGGMLMETQSNSWTGGTGNLIFKMSNDAPTGKYAPTSASNVKLIRDGQTYDVGYVNVGMIVKSNDNWYVLEFWTIVNYKPMLANDILVVEGNFKNTTTGEIMEITKTYVQLNDDGTATFSATEPAKPSTVDAGVMQDHPNGMSGNGLYFRLDANDAFYTSDWTTEYAQTSADNIKLIRNGETISIGIAGRPMFVKFSEIDYYLKLDAGWTIGKEYAPITTDDILIVEGSFEHAASKTTLNITKTYIYYNGSAWICSATEPVLPIQGGMLMAVPNYGWTGGTGDLIFQMDNAAPTGDYAPTSASNIKLIRNGETYDVGYVGVGVIGKTNDTWYTLKFWTIVNYKPMLANDILVVEGSFKNTSTGEILEITKTYVQLNGDGSATFSATDLSNKKIDAGAMSAHTQNWHDDQHTCLYFTMAENAAPSNADTSVRYKPVKATNVQLIRNGETITIGNPGAETIVKISDTLYAVALDAWWWGQYAPIQEGDTLIIEGEFTNASNGFTLNISKTVISIGAFANDAVVFNAAADTEFGAVLLPTSADTVNIGMWNGSYHAFNDTDLQRLQAIGITKITGIDPMWLGVTGADKVNAWLDKVHSYGISVIIDLRSWDGTADYAWMTYDGASVVCTLQDIMDHPAILGFVAFDEPCSTDFEALANTKARFDEIVKDKLFFVNLFGSSAAGTSLVGTVNWALGNRDYDKYYVSQFLTTVGVDVLSWDSYCLVEGEGIRTGYFYNFEVMASKADSVDDIWYTMLSSGHETTSTYYTVPTEGELRWQMAVAMTYGIHNIDHYVYVSHEEDYSCMVEYNTWEPTDLYYDIKTVDNEFLSWDHIYMAYDWVGVGCVDVGSTNEMFSQLKNKLTLANYGVTVTSTAADLLVGVFEHQGDHAYMVTNAGTPGSDKVGDGKEYITSDTTVTLTLAEGDYKCAAVIVNGELTYVAVVNGTVTVDVGAYGYAFVIPVLN